MCCDNRILSKCIASRIKKVIHGIIDKDQNGFIEARFIGDSIRHLLEIIELYEKEKKSSLIFVADFEKAFDSVKWEYIFYILFGIFRFWHFFDKLG